MTLRVAWRHYVLPATDGLARGFFKSTFYLWNAFRATEGVEVVDCGADGADADIVLHFAPAHRFEPIAGKLNVLFSMWEGDALPTDIVAQLQRADVLLVPSEYCAEVWKLSGLEAQVIPLGVPAAFFTLDEHRSVVQLAHQRRRLRFLWVGSMSARKGHELLAPAWRAAFGDRVPGTAQFYAKTIGAEDDRTVRSWFNDSIVIDKRDLSEAEMLALYQSADVFVFPTYGEGFGLPVLEAMAAGCLVLAPQTGGLCDFYKATTGLPIRRSLDAEIEYGDVKYETLIPSVQDVAIAIRTAHDLWGHPKVEELRRHGAEVARRYTWEASSTRLRDVLAAMPVVRDAPVAGVTSPSAGPLRLVRRAPDALASFLVRPEERP